MRGCSASIAVNRRRRALLALLLMSSAIFADESSPAAYTGRAVADVIDTFREQGHPFAYSTALLPSDLRVLAEPTADSPFEIVAEILAPHELTLHTVADLWLVVRLESVPTTDASDDKHSDAAIAPQIENVVVSASRYAIARDVSTSRFSIDQRSIQNMPDIGEDPLRVTQRLPGAAASGASAVAHFRGGEVGEIGIMLNGQWLFDPFHIRDYQNIFSAIDARAIDGVEVFTGGFPVRYGDRMSGLVLMDSLSLEKARHSEVGLSVFNTSVLTTGREGDSRWLFSARRGNLDLVIDPKFGQPSYFDVFGEFDYEFSDNARLSVNALFADDSIELVLESDPAERDQLNSDTRNAQFWSRLDTIWSDSLASTTVLSYTDYSNRRIGFANDPEKLVASVTDHRDVRLFGLRQDWVWSGSDVHRLQWGVHASSAEATFDYDGSAAYFGMQALYQGQPATLTRRARAEVDGGSYAIYLSDQWRLAEHAIVEWGLRWDDQTYTDLSSDSQLSPRVSFLYRPWERSELRFSVGRYFQSQPIQSLQIEDGITRYWPAQRADHVIAGFRHEFSNRTALRVELYHKDFGRVRPRFENLFDPLGLMPELQADRIRLDPSRARARGVEVSADRSNGRMYWWASYTWSRVTDEIDGQDQRRSWDQTHAAQGGIEWRGDRWTFAAAASVHSGWPTTDLRLLDDGSVVPGARNAERHNLFASLDLRLSRRFDLKRGSLLAFVEVSNALNRNNHCCLDWDLTEDAAGEEILERGVDTWMPLLPAIGILWEF